MKARKTAQNTLRMMRREISYGVHAKWSGSGYILKEGKADWICDGLDIELCIKDI